MVENSKSEKVLCGCKSIWTELRFYSEGANGLPT